MDHTTTTAKLRVGLLVNGFRQRRWVYRAIEDIVQSSVAEVVLVVRNEAPRETGWKPAMRKLIEHRQHVVWKLYHAIDDAVFRTAPDPFELMDIRPLLEDCPVLRVKPQQTKYSDYLLDDDVAAIRSHDLDVILRLGFRILKGDVLESARYGVWSYHHGDNLVNRGGPPGFWEVMQGDPVTGSILQILSSRLDAGRVIYRSWASTDRYSVRRNRENVYRKSSAFLIRKLKDLHDRGEAALCAGADTYRPYYHDLYRAPTNLQMLGLVTRYGGRMLRRGWQRAYGREQWFPAFRIGADEGPADVFYPFTPMTPPREVFWADPFPVKHGDRYFIFVEEYVYRQGTGHISVIEMDAQGRYEAAVPALKRPYHLSYPFLFRWKDSYYMIPESSENRSVELYRCVRFPDEWALENVLLNDVRAVDATLHEADGRWWMFVTQSEEGAANTDELYLYHAGSPIGPWMPHRRNPVKSDVRSARPAGRLFRRNGELFRPAQDCSRKYGYAMTINRIVRLTTDVFEEEEVSKILPRWRKGLLATHTLNHADGLTVIDGCINRRRFS